MFSDHLSLPLREKIVRRLLDYPGTLQDEPLLANAVRCLANPTPIRRLCFALLQPLGWGQNAFFLRLDSCAILREMYLYPDRPPSKKSRQAAPLPGPDGGELDWERLAANAEAKDRTEDDGAVYSATNRILPEKRRAAHIRAQTPGTRDKDFEAKVVSSKEFDDLQLLVDVLRELGVDALFISQPFNGIYRELGGVSGSGRQVFYEKLARTLAQAGYPLLDFSAHEKDRFFFNDAGHPSAKAWIFYNRGIDRFYHGTHG